MKSLNKIKSRFTEFLNKEFGKSKFIMVSGSAITLLGHPLYYSIYTFLLPQSYDSIFFRFGSSILSIPLLFTFYYSDKFKPTLMIYWYCWITFILPITFTFIMLMNDVSTLWTIAETMMIFLVILFISNVIIVLIVLSVGMIIGYLCFMSYGAIELSITGLQIAEYLFLLPLALICGILFTFSAKKGQISQAKAKSSALKALAGSIAHELRNPLSSIQLATDSLFLNESQKLDINKFIDFKRQINKTINLAFGIIDLNLSELRGDKINKSDFSYYCANKSVLDSLLIYCYKSEEEKKRVKIDLGNNQIFFANQIDNITTDISNIKNNDNNFIISVLDTPFKYIIFNLIKNSLFYAQDKDDLEITINFEKNKKISKKLIDQFKLNPNINKYNIINIADNGIGISEENINKIFNSYFTSGKKGGTGLGLEFCKRMMIAFGGDIICESKIGKYTKFSLLFPILDPEKQEDAITEISNRKNYLNESNFPQKKILLVDNDKLIIKILSSSINQSCPNSIIDTAYNGKEAIDLIKKNGNDYYDLITTDKEMPIMTGNDFIKEIRTKLKISKNDLAIITYSSLESKTEIEKTLKLGANEYLVKPQTQDIIKKTITKWVFIPFIPNKDKILKNPKNINNLLNNKNIIIVDDNMVNRVISAKNLKQSGANVTQCTDGDEALKLYQENPNKYDLIFTDINMEKMGGIELSQNIRKIEGENKDITKKTPIIAITGDSQKKDIYNILNNQLDDYFIKGKENKEDLVILAKFWINHYEIKNKK